MALRELQKVIALKPAGYRSGKGLSECRGKLEFEGISFAYPSRPDLKVFNGFNLVLEPGKTTAIVGPSGSGKSSIVNLIERWYEPECGRLVLDGESITELDVFCYRSKIGLVQQVSPFQSLQRWSLYLKSVFRIQLFSMTPCFRT